MPTAIIEDDFIYHYNRLQQYTESWVEIDDFQAIFEADDPEVQKNVEGNKKAKSGIRASIAGMVKAIMNVINNIRTSIQGFLKKLKMSDEERKVYEQFKEACKKDPRMKNVKVNVNNYQELQKEFDRLNAECDKALKEAEQGKTEFDLLFDQIKGFTSKLGKGTATAVTMDAALRIAASDKRKAEVILAGLKHDTTLCNELLDGVGEKKFNEFSKNVEALSKRNSIKALLLRRKMNMADAYSNTIMGNVEKTLRDVKGGFGIKGAIDAIGNAKDVSRDANGRIKDAMTRDLHSAGDVKDALRDIKDARDDKADARAEAIAKGLNAKRMAGSLTGTREGQLAGSIIKGAASGALQGGKSGLKAKMRAGRAMKRAEMEDRFINGGRRRQIRKQQQAQASDDYDEE